MNKAFIFPGQASQYVGMAKDLYEKFDLAKEYFETANKIMELDLADICFNGPEDQLKQTFITQPAIFVHSVIVARLLENKNVKPVAVAGHSLGEYSALVAAGVLTFENGLKLVKERSRLMHEAGQKNPGTMGALIGLDPVSVNEVCELASEFGVVQAANFNSPGQIAISGSITAVTKALEIAKEKGAKRAVELVVSGAFHSPLMKDAQQGLSAALKITEMSDSKIPFYSNVTAEAVQNASEIRELLLKQLTNPVKWQDIILRMINDKHSNFLEVGPGKVLKGLVKRIDKEAQCDACGNVDELDMIEG
ncbi:MAG: ACP S-malonyltransferase [Calditrichae bacterium]|nr:ACP S-malonyltransferase [Calditrichota bacterium]MCB9059316.1 ACP S-malonyltransferase [Calditrichia bacterium]